MHSDIISVIISQNEIMKLRHLTSITDLTAYEIKKIIEIVLGIPNEERASKTSIVKEVHKFKTQLETKFVLKVILWDETYTSAIAQQRILESVTKKNKRKNKDLLDMHSAAIILQEYLDSLKVNNN